MLRFPLELSFPATGCPSCLRHRELFPVLNLLLFFSTPPPTHSPLDGVSLPPETLGGSWLELGLSPSLDCIFLFLLGDAVMAFNVTF